MGEYKIEYKVEGVNKGILSVDAKNEHQARYKFCQQMGNYSSIISITEVPNIDGKEKI